RSSPRKRGFRELKYAWHEQAAIVPANARERGDDSGESLLHTLGNERRSQWQTWSTRSRCQTSSSSMASMSRRHSESSSSADSSLRMSSKEMAARKEPPIGGTGRRSVNGRRAGLDRDDLLSSSSSSS